MMSTLDSCLIEAICNIDICTKFGMVLNDQFNRMDFLIPIDCASPFLVFIGVRYIILFLFKLK